jgi:hypothetical protein
VKEPAVITESLPSPVFARDGEPCPGCGAPLAGDQRYCLHCGARRPAARLEFLDVLDADVRARALPAAAFAPPPAPAAPGLSARLQANSGALALAAVLLLMLLVGLLVGHWVTGNAPVAASAPAAPQVIKLEGTGAAAPAASAPADAPASGSAGSTSPAKSKASPSAKGDAAASTPKDAVSVKQVGGDKQAIDKAVKKGKPIATGGKPLPKDNKAPGGGSGFETIG